MWGRDGGRGADVGRCGAGMGDRNRRDVGQKWGAEIWGGDGRRCGAERRADTGGGRGRDVGQRCGAELGGVRQRCGAMLGDRVEMAAGGRLGGGAG